MRAAAPPLTALGLLGRPEFPVQLAGERSFWDVQARRTGFWEMQSHMEGELTAGA